VPGQPDNHIQPRPDGRLNAKEATRSTAIPKLLENHRGFWWFGSLLTPWDVRREIAAKIVDEGADYCLAVKEIKPRFTGNQGIFSWIILRMTLQRTEVFEHQHQTSRSWSQIGRERSYYLVEVPDDLPDGARWKDLCAIGMSNQ